MDDSTNAEIVSDSHHHKKSKKKKSSKQVNDEESQSIVTVDCGLCSDLGDVENTKAKKKKKKHGKDDVESNGNDKVAAASCDNVTEINEPKKKKKKQKESENGIADNSFVSIFNGEKNKNENNNEVDKDSKKKKKKSKQKENSEALSEKYDGEMGNTEQCGNSSLDVASKKHKKKKEHRESDVNGENDKSLDHFNNDKSAEDQTELKDGSMKKKHKKKRDKAEEPVVTMEDQEKINDVLCLSSDVQTKSKKNKKRDKDAAESIDNVVKNVNGSELTENEAKSDEKALKKIKKKHKKDSDNLNLDIVRNSDNSTKESLDKKLDSPSNAVIPEDSTSNSELGQWKTATFSAAGRQEKFFRLLGGRKAPAPSGDEEPPKKRLFSNMAMGQQQQQAMNSALESEFERARGMSFNNKRGTGLGFTAPPSEGKKFYIDTNKSSSVKFDD